MTIGRGDSLPDVAPRRIARRKAEVPIGTRLNMAISKLASQGWYDRRDLVQLMKDARNAITELQDEIESIHVERQLENDDDD